MSLKQSAGDRSKLAPLPKSHAGAYSLQAEATELGSSGGGEPVDWVDLRSLGV